MDQSEVGWAPPFCASRIGSAGPPRRSVANRLGVKHASVRISDGMRGPVSHAPFRHWCPSPRSVWGRAGHHALARPPRRLSPTPGRHNSLQLPTAPPAPEPRSCTAWESATSASNELVPTKVRRQLGLAHSWGGDKLFGDRIAFTERAGRRKGRLNGPFNLIRTNWKSRHALGAGADPNSHPNGEMARAWPMNCSTSRATSSLLYRQARMLCSSS